MLGTQVANYRIDDRLGEGGMGVVYKAIDLNLDRPVALKFLSAELGRDPGLIQRFQSEARSQANLNHTNIATLYNFINVDGNWLIAMEYIDGETLERCLKIALKRHRPEYLARRRYGLASSLYPRSCIVPLSRVLRCHVCATLSMKLTL